MLSCRYSIVHCIESEVLPTSYRTGLYRWICSRGDFAVWRRDGVALVDGALTIDPLRAVMCTTYAFGGDPLRKKNHGPLLLGEAEGPIIEADIPFTQAIPSWSASTPSGSWIETYLRVRSEVNAGGRWTRWYNLGVWASNSSVIRRHSVNGQSDDDGEVHTDTVALRAAGVAFQLKVKFYVEGRNAGPTINAINLAHSSNPMMTGYDFPPGDSTLWGRPALPVPSHSQMVYKDGGDVWCSPLCVCMTMAYWERNDNQFEKRVRDAVEGVFDRVYGGCGNWSFNTAYAALNGYDAYVARCDSLARLEPWIASGVPVVMSVGWNEATGRPLSGAPRAKSTGHLTLLVGFDAEGNPIMNEPAAKTDDAVRLTYRRSELEARWLESSGGAAYFIYPKDHAVPGFNATIFPA